MTTALAKRNCSEEQWQVLAVRARSFRWASAFLSGPQRRRVAALYAFCRAVDDLADAEQASPEARAELLALYRALDDESTEGREARWPDSYLWFQALCLECGIDFGVVRELLRGMMGDLATVRFETDRELLRYCYRAAGTVGLMMCSVLGVVDRRAQRHAVDLGIAMQLTNICRDVLEDAQAARVYLPAERLAQYGVTSEQLVEGSADELGVSLVVNDLLDVAEGYYRSGDAGMRYLPARARWAILIASRLYRGIGRRLRRKHGGNPLCGRVVVPWWTKVGWVLAATFSWFRVAFKRPSSPLPRQQLRRHLDGLPYASSPKSKNVQDGVPVAAGGGAVGSDVNPVAHHAVGHPH